jgi:hypothetical protein
VTVTEPSVPAVAGFVNPENTRFVVVNEVLVETEEDMANIVEANSSSFSLNSFVRNL